MGDACDPDIDGDACDLCPNLTSADNNDNDCDGLGDPRDSDDDDNDGALQFADG